MAGQVEHCWTQESEQSQSEDERQLAPNVLHVPEVVPPTPEEVPPVPVFVHTQPFAVRHACSLNAEQVPNGVPVQLGFQKQPVIALQPWSENAVAQDCPAPEATPPHVPRSEQPGFAAQSAPERTSHGVGVPEQIPGAVEPTPFPAPPRSFAFRPGQSLHEARLAIDAPTPKKTSHDALAAMRELKRHRASDASPAVRGPFRMVRGPAGVSRWLEWTDRIT